MKSSLNVKAINKNKKNPQTTSVGSILIHADSSGLSLYQSNLYIIILLSYINNRLFQIILVVTYEQEAHSAGPSLNRCKMKCSMKISVIQSSSLGQKSVELFD